MRSILIFNFYLFTLLSFFSEGFAQSPGGEKIIQAICNNEDFEFGPGGAITSTSGISGWNTYKVVLQMSPSISNCSIFNPTGVTFTTPVAASHYTANGFIDTLLGPNYLVYSVFGSGPSNGGEVFNPGIPAMRGNSFFRIGDASGLAFNHHAIEKTISVTPANALFRFAYLSVLKVGTTCCDAPSVQIRFFNTSQGNALLPCPVYSINAPSPSCFNTTTPPMIASSNTSIPALNTYYHKWKIEAVDLTPYIGSNVTFKMAVTYCSSGCSKYGYSYLDAQCGPMEIFVNGNAFPAHTNSVTFNSCAAQSSTVVAPPDFSSYQWTGPSGFSSTLSTITTSASGVYTLNILASGTCSTITKYVNINLYPAATLSVTSSNTLICKGKQAKLTASGLTSYTWSPGASSNFSINVTPTVTTTYTVSGYNANGCFATASVTQSVAVCASIDPLTAENNSVGIYPNPNNGEFTLLLDKPFNKGLIQVKNALGQIVYTQELKQLQTKLFVKNLPRGIYYFSVILDTNFVGTGKFLLE